MSTTQVQLELKSSQPANIETEIARLADLDLDALRIRWRNVFGRVAPIGLPKGFLARTIAYRLQAETFGDLDAKSIVLLRRMAMTQGVVNGDGGKEKPIRPAARPALRPGTMLLREWNGQTHQVSVLQSGFAWNGVIYASLSRIAREITGTSWNGFVFFGIGARQKPDASAQKDGKVKVAVSTMQNFGGSSP